MTYQHRVALDAHGLAAQSCDRRLEAEDGDRLLGFVRVRPDAKALDELIRAQWRIENSSHNVRDVTFAEDASRIRKNPDIAACLRSFAYNLLGDGDHDTIKNARWRAALVLNLILKS